LGWHAFSRGAAEKGSPHNVGSISVFAREALDLKGITLEGTERYPQPCTIGDFHAAQLAIALNELEHRPLIERRFAAVAHRVIYWHVHDVGVVHPTTALAMIDDRVRHLISNLS
jgi:protein-tyrosine phosphatase